MVDVENEATEVSEQTDQEVGSGDTESSDVNIPTEATPEEDKETNIRRMRLSKEAAEKDRDDAYRKLKEYQALAEAQRKSAEPEVKESESDDEDFDLNISEDDLVEGKHLGKVANEIKKLKKELKSYKQQSTAVTVETQLKNKYPDFDKVVSKDNIDVLSRDYPELATTISSCKDLYSQAVTAYTMIKRMGVYNEDKFEGDRKKAEQNAAKPRPLASVSPQQGESPLSRANAFEGGLTDELKAELRKEMMEARSRL